MDSQFHCLLLSGGLLDNGIRTALYLTACRMIHQRRTKAKFTDELAQGVVKTEGKRQWLSTAVNGIEFTAEIDTKAANSIQCKFLVNERNLIPEAEFIEERATWLRAAFEFVDSDDEDEEGKGWKTADD